ncbi:MAG: hypothetical protein A3C93_05570 [Candidatus Lloydbacteria bacterium RIFCSPHIGHO2_02_FULL_54_17]|uniref:Uncharacterized protein n=1 Tax=Candidatus Lloydbacteria bacterium RIFCSPHIGHO2_02_FULL_54_17 TaxID=1798664 RepID=A0A1G2DAW3_9BACT|nr:MAG: hypothetical protein A3C93_05570 [Candidatus Lloydbacteria bacterium RIFCSPHIGHO2_02_FULL_54_17]OGZ13057.1 MAG: hypothetical protein A2948_03550 [Candidatus Lloydbacteria bacterium RIFCSPLOWO2_01_FULL_54_18]OGZ16505.1 MAG: hypothetical protein A3H76_04410 [Candidatus Lloydbacteria bacterium RIFCSPLOWO2_02_FULL_54_12]
MDMETTINQRIKSAEDVLEGYYSLFGRNKLYIPAKDLSVSLEQDFWEIILKFQREGLVKKAYLGYGEGMTEGKPEVFKTMGEDGNIPTHTIEIGGRKTEVQLKPIYYIEIDATKLSKDKLLNSKHGSAVTSKVIEKRGEDFYCNNKKIAFESKKSLHYSIFDILYGDDGEDKLIEYAQIDKKLLAGGAKKKPNRSEMIQRIRNAINNGLYHRVDKDKNILKKYVKIERKEGVEFLNPAK